MNFDYGVKLKNVLFHGFNSTSIVELLPILALFFTLNLCLEFLKLYRDYLNACPLYEENCSKIQPITEPLSGDVQATSCCQSGGATDSISNITLPTIQKNVQVAPSCVHQAFQPLTHLPSSKYDFKKLQYMRYCVSGLVYVITLLVSYFAMLGAMTYNIWVILALLLGCALGYFFARVFVFQYSDEITSSSTTHYHLNT